MSVLRFFYKTFTGYFEFYGSKIKINIFKYYCWNVELYRTRIKKDCHDGGGHWCETDSTVLFL